MLEFDFPKFNEECRVRGFYLTDRARVFQFSVSTYCGQLPRDPEKTLACLELQREFARGTKWEAVHTQLLDYVMRKHELRRRFVTLFEPRYVPGVQNSIGDWLLHPWEPGSYLSLREWLEKKGFPYRANA